jgi:hypothetical protein
MHYPPWEAVSSQDACLHPCCYFGFAQPSHLLEFVSLVEAGMVGQVVVAAEGTTLCLSHAQ